MQKPILILGMHRSGTSALTGMLNTLGMSVGKGLIGGNEGNQKGYFERLDLLYTHESILQSLGSSWHDFLPLPDRWWGSPEMAPFKAEIENVIHREFQDKPLWGVKDPRLCRLLPLWLAVLEKIQQQPSFIFVLRDPDEIAASMGKRNAFPQEKSGLLWLTYILEAEWHSRGYPRIFITMDQLLADWRTQVGRIEEALQLKWPVPVEAAADPIDSFLSPNLRHHRKSETPCPKPLSKYSLVAQTQRALKAAHASDQGKAHEQFDAVRESFHEINQLYAPVFQNAAIIQSKGQIDMELLGSMARAAGKSRVGSDGAIPSKSP